MIVRPAITRSVPPPPTATARPVPALDSHAVLAPDHGRHRKPVPERTLDTVKTSTSEGGLHKITVTELPAREASTTSSVEKAPCAWRLTSPVCNAPGCSGLRSLSGRQITRAPRECLPRRWFDTITGFRCRTCASPPRRRHVPRAWRHPSGRPSRRGSRRVGRGPRRKARPRRPGSVARTWRSRRAAHPRGPPRDDGPD